MLRYFILHEKNEGAYFDPMLCYFILHEKQMKEHILTLCYVISFYTKNK